MTYSAPDGFSKRKRRALNLSHNYVIPGRVETFHMFGIDLVIGKRDGYRMWDLDGHELMDFHLNGGTFNLGHRNPEIMKTLTRALTELDIGNHHFPSEARADLAEKLAAATGLHYTVFASGGSEANDVAIKSSRRFTGKRKIVGIEAGYHGRTGLSGGVGDDKTARYFKSDYPGEYIKVPFNDLEAMEGVLSNKDIAAVILETIPATYGFPVPGDDYLPGVKKLCERYGSLYIADEVQTGLGRTGHVWGVDAWGVKPDILVTGKGLSGGMYPVAATVMKKDVGAWLTDNGWGHVSTFGGAEIGCVVGSRVLDICGDPAVLDHARNIAEYLGGGLEDIQKRHPYLIEIRQKGLIMGLKFDDANGAVTMMKALYDKGIWAIFAGFDLSVLQFKPGLLIDVSFCDEALERFEDALSEVEASALKKGGA
ncbi:MAG: aminotransferase class III-fold pyridoxal phosphate-dependent enzyme [Desulfobacterales bacterium]